MNSNIYPSAYDLREYCMFFLKRSSLNRFAQSEGIFLVNASSEDIADTLSHVIMERKKIEMLREEAYQTSSSCSMSGFNVINSKDFSLSEVYSELRDGRTDFGTSGYRLGTLKKEVTEGGKEVYYGSLDYEKKRPGRIEFMDTDQGYSEFTMFETEEGKWQIEVNGSKPNDGREVRKLFEQILKIKGEKNAKISTLEIDDLSAPQTIAFFDRLMPCGLGEDWTFQDVKQLTFKRGKEDVEESEDEEISDTDLMGIKQAILEGKNLRDADFVKKFEQQGCMFTAMTFEYIHNTLPKTVRIHAEFKGNPKIFEVSLVKYFETVGPEAKMEAVSIPKEENLKLQSLFWNNARNIFYRVKADPER